MSALDKILDPERWNDDSYGDLVTQVSSPTGANTLDAARGELRALRAELVELREAYDEVAAKRITLHAENAAMREALERYGAHRRNCTYFDPHPVTAERPCSCGLSALLRKDGERG